MKKTRLFAFALVTLAFLASPLAANGSPSAGDSPTDPGTNGATPLPGYAEMAALMGDDGTDADSGASVEGGEGYPDAETGATPGGGKPLKPDFLGVPTSVNAHRIAGYTAGGLLLAGGIVGAVRFLDLKERSHARREDGEDGEDGDGYDDECKAIIHEEWANGQALRWTHVGLVATGEALYLYDAATGMSMMKRNKTPSLAAKIHRNAFFVHAGLMAADVILGILLTNALDKGEHGQVVAYGAAHASIGVAVPLVIIGSGLAVDLMPRY